MRDGSRKEVWETECGPCKRDRERKRKASKTACGGGCGGAVRCTECDTARERAEKKYDSSVKRSSRHSARPGRDAQNAMPPISVCSPYGSQTGSTSKKVKDYAARYRPRYGSSTSRHTGSKGSDDRFHVSEKKRTNTEKARDSDRRIGIKNGVPCGSVCENKSNFSMGGKYPGKVQARRNTSSRSARERESGTEIICGCERIEQAQGRNVCESSRSAKLQCRCECKCDNESRGASVCSFTSSRLSLPQPSSSSLERPLRSAMRQSRSYGSVSKRRSYTGMGRECDRIEIRRIIYCGSKRSGSKRRCECETTEKNHGGPCKERLECGCACECVNESEHLLTRSSQLAPVPVACPRRHSRYPPTPHRPPPPPPPPRRPSYFSPAPQECVPPPPICTPPPPSYAPPPPAHLPPPVCTQLLPVCTPPPPVYALPPPVCDPSPPVCYPSSPVCTPPAPVCTPLPPECTPLPPECNPPPRECTPPPPECTPPPVHAPPPPVYAQSPSVCTPPSPVCNLPPLVHVPPPPVYAPPPSVCSPPSLACDTPPPVCSPPPLVHAPFPPVYASPPPVYAPTPPERISRHSSNRFLLSSHSSAKPLSSRHQIPKRKSRVCGCYEQKEVCEGSCAKLGSEGLNCSCLRTGYNAREEPYKITGSELGERNVRRRSAGRSAETCVINPRSAGRSTEACLIKTKTALSEECSQCDGASGVGTCRGRDWTTCRPSCEQMKRVGSSSGRRRGTKRRESGTKINESGTKRNESGAECTPCEDFIRGERSSNVRFTSRYASENGTELQRSQKNYK